MSGEGAQATVPNATQPRSPLWKAFHRSGRMAPYALDPVLRIANALLGLLIPLLLGPAEFGVYALVVTLYAYGIILDFGLAQLIDRRVPALVGAGRQLELARLVSALLWLRLCIASTALVGGSLVLTGLSIGGMLPFGLASGVLSLAAGLAYMVALGPLSVHRAKLHHRTFNLGNCALGAVLFVMRTVGLLAAGVLGCFAALALGYGLLAALLQSRMLPDPRHRPTLRRAASLLGQGLPLFLVGLVWAFYMTAIRWTVSRLAPPEEFGQFAFGANVVYLLVGTIGSLSQFYYPRAATRFAAGGAFSISRTLAYDLGRLALGAGFVSAVGILLCGPFIGFFLHRYADAVPAMQTLIAAIPALAVASWLMPLLLSTSVAQPWLEGLVVYPAAVAILVVTATNGYHRAGPTGAAYGLVASALPLLAAKLWLLRRARVMSWGVAAALLSINVAVTAGLLLLALR
ncbi:hypothetical protein GCM10009416_41360 [Craurococcus roseus]|uniref:Polysaccharide biosynthesis protein n=1 Tax=Craurococcus roseus TaxID=77585 RepID=A0ABN1FVT8_9PROT